LLNGESLYLSLDKLALMPQRDQLFEWRTIEKNIMLGLEIRHTNTKQNRELALELLKKYGLGDFAKMHPSQLSGGMKQRAALIRTLVTQPQILLLDEPFSALDFQTRLNVCDDVYRIIKQEKKTAILVSHDISECISLCDKIVVLSHRPTNVKEEIIIDIDKSLTPLKRREDRLFSNYFEKIWILLEEKKNDG
jgi:NitT/TauT family transport system ATP-binding protein